MIRRLTALSVVLILSVACEHKPFCWHHPHDGMLRVEFAWWDAPEAEYTVRSMAFYAYPKEGGGKARRFDFAGSKGGTISLPVGDYHFLCLNSDTETYTFSGEESHKTFTIHTRDSYILAGMDIRADGGGDFSEDDDIKRAEGTYDEGVKESSQEGIYGHTLEDYNIHGQVGVTQVVTMYPKPVVIHYHVIIENIGCLETVLKVSGTLSGLPSKVRVHHMEVPGQGDDNNIVPFSMVPTDDNVLEGHFYAFPHCPTDPETWSKHKLCCYVINEQEERRFFEWDVTSQVDEQDGETYVKIVVRDMDVCGMNDLGPVVDPWIPTPPIIIPMQ